MIKTTFDNVKKGSYFYLYFYSEAMKFLKTSYEIPAHKHNHHPTNAIGLSGDRVGHDMSIGPKAPAYVKSCSDLLKEVDDL